MSAPNSPELISLPSLSSQILIKYSYKGIAISWPAEFIYEGLFPFLVDAIKVNWEITKISVSYTHLTLPTNREV